MTYELHLPVVSALCLHPYHLFFFATTVQLRVTALLPAISAGSFHASDEAAQCSVASRIQAGCSLHTSGLKMPFT